MTKPAPYDFSDDLRELIVSQTVTTVGQLAEVMAIQSLLPHWFPAVFGQLPKLVDPVDAQRMIVGAYTQGIRHLYAAMQGCGEGDEIKAPKEPVLWKLVQCRALTVEYPQEKHNLICIEGKPLVRIGWPKVEMVSDPEDKNKKLVSMTVDCLETWPVE